MTKTRTASALGRRGILAAATSAVVAPLAFAPLALPRPALARAAQPLVFVPQTNLNSLDPVWTTATVTRNFSLLIYDTLYGVTARMEAKPQMAAGHVIGDDGKKWTITLREGLRFHDGEPVLARDCVASLHRWMKRDGVGQTLAARLDALEAPDDRTLVFRLRQRFPALAFALARSAPNPAVIQPARIAATDPFKQITATVGSGPFRFVADEYVSGIRSVYTRFDGYRPREEPVDFTAGGKRALVERIEWRVIPDPSTQANALMTGEVDWVEQPLPDLLGQLRRAKDVVVVRLDPYGIAPGLRLNHLQGPTANQAVRQVILAAIDQTEVMQALMGDDRSAYAAPVGVFMPSSDSASDAGMDRIGGRKTPAELRGMLQASGYAGERMVLMHPTDQPFYDAMTQVVAARLKAIGINLDDAAMDWGTVVQRRTSKEPLDKGGWSGFVAGFPAVDLLSPLASIGVRGNGRAAWFGWPDDPKIEALRDTWLDAPDPAEQKRLAAEIQAEALTNVAYVPLGQYFQSAAWRSNLSGIVKGPAPVFWNVRKA